MFLIDTNNLYQNLALKSKLFADDIPLFSVIENIDDSSIELSNNLKSSVIWYSS